MYARACYVRVCQRACSRACRLANRDFICSFPTGTVALTDQIIWESPTGNMVLSFRNNGHTGHLTLEVAKSGVRVEGSLLYFERSVRCPVDTHGFSLSHSHTHTLTHTFTQFHSHSHTLSLSLMRTQMYIYTHTHTLTLTHSHTHTHTHTHTR